MRILFITDNFPPEVNAPATRTYEHARQWLRLGAEVTVLTCAPNFPHGRVFDGYANRLRQVEDMDGIRVVRLWSYIAPNAGFTRRILDYVSFAASAFVAGLFEKADVIVATSPQFFTTWAGWALSKLKRKPWIFELRDLWPESIRAVGAMRQGAALRLLERIELGLYRNCDKVVALTPAFKKNLVSRGIDPGKIQVIPNGANLELYAPRESDPELARGLGLEGKFVISYIGTHGMAHGLDFVLRAAARLGDDRIRFLLVGDGAEKGTLRRLARDLGLTNVVFHDPVPKERVPDLLALSDVALVNLKKSETFKTVIPSKIFEAAAIGLPILLGVDGQAREIVEAYEAGLYYEPENEEQFLEAVQSLADDANRREQHIVGGARLAQRYDRKKLAEEMHALFIDVIRN